MTGLRHLFDSTIGKWLDSPSQTLMGVWVKNTIAFVCFAFGLYFAYLRLTRS